MRVRVFVFLAACCFLSQDARSQVKTAPAPAIPINPPGQQTPPPPPLERFSPVNGLLPRPPQAVLPSPVAPPLAGVTEYIPKLRLYVRMNAQNVVEVVAVDAQPVYIYVARGGGLSGEVFVPGDTIYGFDGRAVTSIQELHALTQSRGWRYVEGVDYGTNVGVAYIGRVYIE